MHLQLKRIAVASLVAETAYSQSGICTFTEYVPSCAPQLSPAPPAFLQTCGGVTFDGNGTFPSGPRGGNGAGASGAASATTTNNGGAGGSGGLGGPTNTGGSGLNSATGTGLGLGSATSSGAGAAASSNSNGAASGSQTGSSATPSTSVPPLGPVQNVGRFIISLTGANGLRTFLNRQGAAQDDCTSTTAFALSSDGRLSFEGDPDTVFSVDVGVDFGPLQAYKPGKAIQTTWAVTQNDVTWTNNVFLNGAAVFCSTAEGVVAYYTTDPPSDCSEVTFLGEDVVQCPGFKGDPIQQAQASAASASAFPSASGIYTNASSPTVGPSTAPASTSAPIVLPTDVETSSVIEPTEEPTIGPSTAPLPTSIGTSGTGIFTVIGGNSSFTFPSLPTTTSIPGVPSLSIPTVSVPSGFSNATDVPSVTVPSISVPSISVPSSAPNLSISTGPSNSANATSASTTAAANTTASGTSPSTSPSTSAAANITDPQCNSLTPPGWGVNVWSLKKIGSAFLAAQAPAPQTFLLNGTYNAPCDAIQACINNAVSISYYSIAAILNATTNQWSCTAIRSRTTDSSAWTDSDPTVKAGYGARQLQQNVTNPQCTINSNNTWTNFYANYGYVLPANNAANDDPTNNPTKTTQFDGTQADCTALNNCISFAGFYGTVSVVFDDLQRKWNCSAFHGKLNDPTAFSQTAANVPKAYGYVRAAKAGANCTVTAPYSQFFSGSGVVIPAANIENDFPQRAPYNTTFDANLATCDAANQCVAFASTSNNSVVDLHFDNSLNAWVCSTFWKSVNVSSALFSQAQSSAELSYGYARPQTDPLIACGNTTGAFTNFARGRYRLPNPPSSLADQFTQTAIFPNGASGVLYDCDAVSRCQAIADKWHLDTFTVYWNGTNSQYYCIAYHFNTTDASIYSTFSSDVGKYFGYSRSVRTPQACDVDPVGETFLQIAQRTGSRLPTVNFANDGTAPAINATFNYTLTDCQAANQCWQIAANATPAGYNTFEVVFNLATPGWECVAYPGQAQTSGFTDAQPKWDQVLGYYQLTRCNLSIYPTVPTDYTEVYKGFGSYLNDTNPANDNPTLFPKYNKTTPTANFADSCNASSDCSVFAAQYNAHTFNVWQDNVGQTHCDVYHGSPFKAVTDVSPYTVRSGNAIGRSRVFTLPITDPSNCNNKWNFVDAGTGKTLGGSTTTYPGNDAANPSKRTTYTAASVTGGLCGAAELCRNYATAGTGSGGTFAGGYHAFIAYQNLDASNVLTGYTCDVYKNGANSTTGLGAQTQVGQYVLYANIGNVYPKQ